MININMVITTNIIIITIVLLPFFTYLCFTTTTSFSELSQEEVPETRMWQLGFDCRLRVRKEAHKRAKSSYRVHFTDKSRRNSMWVLLVPT